jgi:Cys-rich protein (TIGR01571 family)
LYLTHSIQKDGNVIDSGVEDMGEEMDMNIPYNRGLPADAFDDLNFDSGSGSISDAAASAHIFILFSDVWRKFMQNLTPSFIMGVLAFIVIFIVGMLYKITPKQPQGPPDDGEEHSPEALDKQEWRYGLCTCYSNPKVSCIAFCCPAVRWAETIEMSGLMPFWLGLTVCALLLCMSEATFGLTYLLFLLMATHGRQQIKALFGIPDRSIGGAVYDFCTYSCCCCCAIVQEARQLDEAYAVGHPVVMFTLESVPPVEIDKPVVQ